MKPANKLKVLILSLPVVIWICYQAGLARTLETKATFKNLKAQEQHVRIISTELSKAKAKEKYLDSLLEKRNLKSRSIENNLIQVLSETTKRNQTTLTDFNPPHVVSNQKGALKTYHFELEGDFIGLLKTLHFIETQSGFGQISHYNLKRIKKNRGKIEAEVFMQSYQ